VTLCMISGDHACAQEEIPFVIVRQLRGRLGRVDEMWRTRQCGAKPLLMCKHAHENRCPDKTVPVIAVFQITCCASTGSPVSVHLLCILGYQSPCTCCASRLTRLRAPAVHPQGHRSPCTAAIRQASCWGPACLCLQRSRSPSPSTARPHCCPPSLTTCWPRFPRVCPRQLCPLQVGPFSPPRAHCGSAAASPS